MARPAEKSGDWLPFVAPPTTGSSSRNSSAIDDGGRAPEVERLVVRRADRGDRAVDLREVGEPGHVRLLVVQAPGEAEAELAAEEEGLRGSGCGCASRRRGARGPRSR